MKVMDFCDTESMRSTALATHEDCRCENACRLCNVHAVTGLAAQSIVRHKFIYMCQIALHAGHTQDK